MTDPVPAAAPTRVCPHCHAQSTTPGKKCPHCGKKFKKRGMAFKLLIVFLVLLVLGIAGCAALIGGTVVAVDEAVKETQKESDRTSISEAEYEAIRTGMTRAAVEKTLGEPSNVQESDIDTSSFEGAGASESHDCIYYNKKGEIASAYQFCFTNEKLSTKSSY